jgi:hypothetical protein
VPIFMVFMGRLTHEIKNPMNNETWEAVWQRYIAVLFSSDLNFLDFFFIFKFDKITLICTDL